MVQSVNVPGIVNAFRVLWNPSLAMPHIIVNDIRNIHFQQLKNQGQIQAMAFDKDNCLTAPYIPEIHPPFKKAWAECKETFGKENIGIVSNSAGTNDDQFNDSYPSSIFTQANKLENSLGVPVLRHSEKKPSGGEALVKHFDNVSGQQNIAMVGDRILTDVLFGNLNGNLTIWTSQIVTEKGDNKAALFFRRVEHGLIRFLQKMNVQPPQHPATTKATASDYTRS
ncbi:hypothetical protein INT45_011610 [Circinella minor]|uniref:HAD-superfamily phosphatase n=1 Tax=Circinella minor TaxID=1195481 RepID=A0A8H7VJG3_9FUNG|nr:hypothetical protein INT45_011610 [Circinella minor]